MNRLAFIVALGSLLLTTAVSIMPFGTVTVHWQCATNQMSDDGAFLVEDTPVLGQAWATNWVSMTNLLSTDGTNIDGAGNYLFNVTNVITPGAHFWRVQASNFWGVSDFSNTASTPPLPMQVTNLGISK